MSGQAQLPVWDTINAAWIKVSGSKATFWGAIGILAAIMFGIGILEGITEKSWAIAGLIQMTGNILGYFLQLGLIYMGITRAKDMPINFKMIFNTFDLQLALRIIGLYILQTLLFLIPAAIGATGIFIYAMGGLMSAVGAILVICSIIGIIVLVIRLSLSIAFVLEAAAAPVEAMKKSIAATDGNFLSLLGIYILQLIILLASMIPLGIGLIWSLPLALICYGMVYKQLRVNA